MPTRCVHVRRGQYDLTVLDGMENAFPPRRTSSNIFRENRHDKDTARGMGGTRDSLDRLAVSTSDTQKLSRSVKQENRASLCLSSSSCNCGRSRLGFVRYTGTLCQFAMGNLRNQRRKLRVLYRKRAVPDVKKACGKLRLSILATHIFTYDNSRVQVVRSDRFLSPFGRYLLCAHDILRIG